MHYFSKSIEMKQRNLNYLPVYRSKSFCLLETEDYYSALETLNEALYLFGKDHVLLNNKTYCLGFLGRYGEAFDTIAECLEIAPPDYSYAKNTKKWLLKENIWGEWPSRQADADKIWKVEFNLPLDPQTVSSRYIFVTDKDYNDLETKAVVDKNNNRVALVEPINKYQVGKDYYLFVTQNVKSHSGVNLVKPIKMKFTID